MDWWHHTDTHVAGFQGDFRLLSNFESPPVTLDGVRYRSLEHAYQAAKTNLVSERKQIADCAFAGVAKRLGRTLTMRPDWDRIKVQVMRELLKQKFAYLEYHNVLRRTGSRQIIELNLWGDRFWGQIDLASPKAPRPDPNLWIGSNYMGQLLMEIRRTL